MLEGLSVLKLLVAQFYNQSKITILKFHINIICILFTIYLHYYLYFDF